MCFTGFVKRLFLRFCLFAIHLGNVLFFSHELLASSAAFVPFPWSCPKTGDYFHSCFLTSIIRAPNTYVWSINYAVGDDSEPNQTVFGHDKRTFL